MISLEECQAIGEKNREEERKRNENMAKIRNDELRRLGVNVDAQPSVKPQYDHPSMPEDGFVTVLYIVGMIASLIFKDFWIPWLILTAGYGKFISRRDND